MISPALFWIATLSCVLAPDPTSEPVRQQRQPHIQAPVTAGRCVDKTLEQELLAKRKFRLTTDRLYVKNLRHELTFLGGYYVSDLFEGTFSLGGTYTFFASENFGTELSFGWSRLLTSTAQTLERANNFDFALGDNNLYRVFATLMWSPLYGKMRLGGKILRYDFYLGAGPGIVVDPLSYGVGGNFALGVRLFVHPAVAFRFDLRDYLFRQELLQEQFVVNDIAFTVGVGIFLPPGN